MPERRVIHSMGRFRWQLAVCDGDVTASRHLPTADGSIYVTTADFGLGVRDAGRDELSPYEVVAAYHDRASDPPAFPVLLERVREALRAVPDADASNEVVSA